MDYEIVLTDEALDDLRKIVDYLAEESPAAAERVGNEILDRCEVLGRFPRAGSPVDSMPRVRRLIRAPCQIYYFVDPSRPIVTILHFRHGSRLPPKL